MNALPTPDWSPEEINPGGYGPKGKPVLVSMAEQAAKPRTTETVIEKVHSFVSIVDRPNLPVVGYCVPISYESRGYAYAGQNAINGSFSDGAFAAKLITEGDIALLADVLGLAPGSYEVVSARFHIEGDGNYQVLVGIEIPQQTTLPDELPENVKSWTIPAARYAKFQINDQGKLDRDGFHERMQADDFFISSFRKETPYVLDSASTPWVLYDATGDLLAKYEPIRLPADERDTFASYRFKPVVLPEMKVACCVAEAGIDDSVIFQFFEVEQQVYACPVSRYYLHEYYGFPVNNERGTAHSAFGIRVSSFEGLPDTVKQVVLPGGLYLHITQLEFNGDNPSMLYEAAYQHLHALYLADHPNYDRDESRHIIARFRQGNCASIFVPLLKK
ncbi:GyrI-like domain-containing protein [Gorillibacterium sp. CAU 1737]|uniref:GyrI-like domain-containing protein n=1 Tax=Gorillibacterium sp. CAU 1737 TaxID=3140362 RepID=UPI003260DA68